MKPQLAVFECHHLGDAVMALPFLRGAQNLFDVHIFSRPPVATMLGDMLPEVDCVAVTSWLDALRKARALRLTPDDATACVWADTRMAVAAKISGAGRRAGFPMTPLNYYASRLAWRKRRLFAGTVLASVGTAILGNPLLNLPVDRDHEEQPHLACWRQLAAALGFVLDESLPWFSAPEPSPTITRFVEASRKTHHKVLVIHPGARLPTKRWPTGRFAELLRRLAGPGGPTVLIIAPPGEEHPPPIGSNQMTIPSENWKEMASALAVADLVLANDSFASHTAAALGKPVLTLFGSGNPAWFAPYGNANRVLASEACTFRPCIDRCVMPSPVCIEALEVDFVEYRLREALSGK